MRMRHFSLTNEIHNAALPSGAASGIARAATTCSGVLTWLRSTICGMQILAPVRSVGFSVLLFSLMSLLFKLNCAFLEQIAMRTCTG